MPRKCQRAKLILSEEQKDSLVKMSQSRTLPLQEVQRSRILLKYVDGIGLSAISKELKTTRVTVYKCIDKALSMGVEAALKDTFHRPFDPTITEEAKSWVIGLLVRNPKNMVMLPNFGRPWLSMLEIILWSTDIHGLAKKKQHQGNNPTNPFEPSNTTGQNRLSSS